MAQRKDISERGTETGRGIVLHDQQPLVTAKRMGPGKKNLAEGRERWKRSKTRVNRCVFTEWEAVWRVSEFICLTLEMLPPYCSFLTNIQYLQSVKPAAY